ncbi:DUF1992 domain-containing protein [Pantoea sp. A4]|uniref:DnaJ family domain-containing protein n=1 Tax=Pantoea sp. A4 TaxID=1225184 RepID=UPI0003610172|nr:DUF1992 domain-containing protein [Pantoea sp. A4]
MWLIDQLAEQHIRAAQEKGELSNLPGEGAPLILDDDSQVPAELRTGYRLLKNAGFLPPELALRKEALEVRDLINQLDPEDQARESHRKHLAMLELRLQQAGVNTDFLYGHYGDSLRDRLTKDQP